MHRSARGAFCAALFVLSTLHAGAALAHDPVQVSLRASRVVLDARGRETLAPAERARPGEVIEYLATYRNAAAAPVRQVDATLPIPAGTVYVPGSARPAPQLASLDGVTYAAPPLKRRERLPDGREVMREVPATDYRWLRWSLDAIPGGTAEAVRARVRVTDAPAP